ncbi:hypothetical protein PSTT_11663, partial [Puccinia striiformis]
DLTSWKSVVISLQPHLESCRSNGMVGQTTLDSYFRSSRTSEADPDRSIPATNPGTNAIIDPALLPLPSSRTNSRTTTSVRSGPGTSTVAIQEQLTTDNVRALGSRAETHTIIGDHSDQDSIAIITGEFKRGSSKKELPSDHRVSVPNPPGVQDPVPDGDSHRQPSGGSDVPGTSHQEPPLVGAAHTNQCIDFVNRGMESYYRSLTETGGRTSKPTEPSAAVPTTNQNTTPDSGGLPAEPTMRRTPEGRERQNEEPSRVSSVGVRRDLLSGSDGAGRLPVGRPKPTPSSRELSPLTVLSAKEILEILFSKIEQVVDGNSKRAVSQIQKSLSTLSVPLSREISTTLSSKLSLLQDSVRDQMKAIQFSLSNLHASCNAQVLNDKSHLKLLQDVSAESSDSLKLLSDLEERLTRTLRTSQDEVVAHLVSKPECDSTKLVQAIQELDARVYWMEALLEANLNKETEFPYVHSSASVSSGINTACVQTIVENTMSKHIDRLESILIARLDQIPTRETTGADLSEEVVQQLEVHSKHQRKAFCKLSNCLDRDSHLLHEKIDRATGQFRSGEARLRDEVVELSQLIQGRGGQNRNVTATPAPVQNRRLLQSTGQDDDSEDNREPIDNDLKKQLTNAIAKSDWPTFSGEGEYDLVGFCRWIDAARTYSYIDDKVIVLKLLTMLTGSAHGWFDTARLTKPSQKAVEEFVPGDVSPAVWVTQQYNCLQCFAPEASQEAINFKLLRLMDDEVEYAAKTAMRGEVVDLTMFINILEDICDKTRLGRRRFPPKPTLPIKQTSAPTDKPKATTSTITCYTCNETRHTT